MFTSLTLLQLTLLLLYSSPFILKNVLLPHGGKRTEVLAVSQGGDFPVLALQGLRRINSFSGLCSQRKILP